jgi:transposase
MPAPIRLRLRRGEKRALWRLRMSATSPRVWARATALLMLSMGESVAKVAAALSVCVNTITNWKHRWLKCRYFRMADRPRVGRPPDANARYRRMLREAVECGPRAFGYLFTVWSAARLAAHMRTRTRVALSEKQVRVWLRRLGFAYRSPKHTLRSRQNRRAVHTAKLRLKALKKGLSGLLHDSSSGSRMKETFISILI